MLSCNGNNSKLVILSICGSWGWQDAELFKQHQLVDALLLENRELFRRRNVVMVAHTHIRMHFCVLNL